MARKYEFTEYKNIYEPDNILYGLKAGGVERLIDGVKFIEVTPDFQRVQMIRQDSLRAIGTIVKVY